MADDCAALAGQIAALKAQVGEIPKIDINAIIEQVKIALIPVIGGIVFQQTSGFKSDIELAKGLANQAKNEANSATTLSKEAKAEADAFARAKYARMDDLSKEITDREMGDGLVERKLNIKIDATDADIAEALAEAKKATQGMGAFNQELQQAIAAEKARATGAEGGLGEAVAGKAAKSEVDGIRGSISALSESVSSRFSAIERSIVSVSEKAGEALSKGLEAIGISKSAQTVAGEALGKILGVASKIAEIFVIIAAIQEIIAQIKTLEVLGERINAVEREVEAVGASVSGILGKLLGLQNRIANNEASIADVRGIASNALNIGNAANALATRAMSIGIDAKNEAASALVRAGEAVATTAAVLALFRGIKVLRGEPGIRGTPGINGRNGVDGRNAINGKDGKNGVSIPGINGRNGVDGAPGVTTVVQIPGQPGADGAPGRPGSNGFPGRNGTNGTQGINGVNGRNGTDVNPADLAGLRALIIQQHGATRVNINATSSGLVNGVKTFFTTQLAGLTALITTIATNTYVEKAMSLMTLAVTIHNGFMLSNNLAQTLGTIVDQCVALVVPKGIDGQPISITHVLGGAVMDIVKNVVGAENYTTITTDFAKANRIYQAGVNVFNQVGNAVGILTSGLELIAGNTGKIGNALKIWGVVGEKAYNFMNPQPNLQGKFFNFINTATAEANTIQMMIAIPIGLSAAAIEINSSTGALIKELDQKDPVDIDGNPVKDVHGNIVHYKPGLTVQDPTETIKAEMQAELDSKNIILATIEDIFDGGD